MVALILDAEKRPNPGVYLRLCFLNGAIRSCSSLVERIYIAIRAPENVFLSTVRSADPPAYRGRRRGSAVDPFEPQIRELPKDCNRMPATVIAERIGWTRGILILRECVAELRPRISIRIRISAPTIVPASSRNGTFMVSCGGDPVLASDRVAA